VRLGLNILADDATMATGDVVQCSGCSACLSKDSILVPADAAAGGVLEDAAGAGGGVMAGGDGGDGGGVAMDGGGGGGGGGGAGGGGGGEGSFSWTCEFCAAANAVELDAEEIPSKDELDYLMEPPPVALDRQFSGSGDNIVIFCIDISGSMCVTQEVEGTFKLKGGGEDMSGLRGAEDDRNQYMPGEKRNVTYVSRLQAMQAAVNTQIETMAKDTPSRRVGIVTFNGDVTIVGDGTNAPTVLTGDRLNSYEDLVQVRS
jgi:hypothetical protein